MGCTVKMAVIALPNAVIAQKAQDLGTGIALINGRIMEKADLLPLPRRFQRGLQQDLRRVKIGEPLGQVDAAPPVSMT